MLHCGIKRRSVKSSGNENGTWMFNFTTLIQVAFSLKLVQYWGFLLRDLLSFIPTLNNCLCRESGQIYFHFFLVNKICPVQVHIIVKLPMYPVSSIINTSVLFHSGSLLFSFLNSATGLIGLWICSYFRFTFDWIRFTAIFVNLDS